MEQTRRQHLASLLATASGLLLPSSAFSQQPSYSPDQILEREYKQREAQWKENVINYANNRPLVSYTPIQLSPEFDSDDLISVLGGEWNAMSPERKNKTLRGWANTPHNNRKKISWLYKNTFGYYLNELNEKQREQFNEFNAAYLYAIKNHPSPSSVIFATRDGSATAHYERFHPWIRLNRPTNSDRMIIYCQGYRDDPQDSRLNFNAISAYANQAFLERDAELAIKAREQ